MRFLLTTDPGLEAVAADEVAESGCATAHQAAPYGHEGLLRVETDDPERLYELATIHHVIEIRGEAEAGSVEQVRAVLAGTEFPELGRAASFRVTSKSAGDDGLTRMELQRAAGAVLHDRYGTPVDLEGFEVQVRVDRYGTRLVAGVQRTRDSLGDRIRRARPLRSSLKPTIAAAMLRLAGAQRGVGRLLDPMCGAGTIPIEARRINPELELFASDWDAETVTVARETLTGHAVEAEVRMADARSLHEAYGRRFDFIVTDPPYGLRQARRTSLTRLYGALLPSFERALADAGRIVLVVLKYRTFLAALEGTGLRIVDERSVDLGGPRPRILVLERMTGVPG